MLAIPLFKARNSHFAFRMDTWESYSLPAPTLALCFHPQAALANLHCAYRPSSILCFGFSPHCCFWLKWTFPLFLILWVILGEMLSLSHLQITYIPLVFSFSLLCERFLNCFQFFFFFFKVSGDVVRIVFSRSTSHSDCSFCSFSLCARVCVCVTYDTHTERYAKFKCAVSQVVVKPIALSTQVKKWSTDTLTQTPMCSSPSEHPLHSLGNYFSFLFFFFFSSNCFISKKRLYFHIYVSLLSFEF